MAFLLDVWKGTRRDSNPCYRVQGYKLNHYATLFPRLSVIKFISYKIVSDLLELEIVNTAAIDIAMNAKSAKHQRLGHSNIAANYYHDYLSFIHH